MSGATIDDRAIEVGDQVVHQGSPGRFLVVEVRPSPAMNVYGSILTLRGPDGGEIRVLDTSVRRVAAASASE